MKNEIGVLNISITPDGRGICKRVDGLIAKTSPIKKIGRVGDIITNIETQNSIYRNIFIPVKK